MASGMRRMKRGERNVMEIQKGTQQNRRVVGEDPYSFCFAVSSLCTVLTTGFQLLGILSSAVIKMEIAVL